MKNLYLLLLMLSIILYSSYVYFNSYQTRTLPKLAVESFIKEQFLQKNGLLLTTMGGNPSDETWAAGDYETLSETFGLWIIYLHMVGDEKKFNENIKLLKRYYLTPELLVYWKLDNNGEPLVQTNALLDDLRIFAAIENATKDWNKHSYDDLANKLAHAITTYGENNTHLIDFYDRFYDEKTDTITLAYIDGVTLNKLAKRISSTDVIDRSLAILSEAEDTPFFPKQFNLNSGYIQDFEVHMIEQLYTGLHKAQLGERSPSFLAFIKTELETGQLFGRYYVETLKPSVPVESSSVYALTILYALEIGEKSLAISAFEKMKSLQTLDSNSTYFGGYVDEEKGQSHIFDNLLPLLAERSFIDAQLAK